VLLERRSATITVPCAVVKRAARPSEPPFTSKLFWFKVLYLHKHNAK
jgi:hypothetical protein